MKRFHVYFMMAKNRKFQLTEKTSQPFINYVKPTQVWKFFLALSIPSMCMYKSYLHTLQKKEV